VDAGVTITLRHAELLQHPPYGPADGSIYVGNLRSARATDVYTTGGASEGAEVWEPPIGTYHGFRFVEVSGLPFPPTLDTVTAIFIRSDVPAAGFVTFPPAANTLNQLQHAVNWAIGNNLMGVVSDCDQRDERKGWMGDSGLSLQPTHYNYAMGAFYTFWALQIRDAQRNPRDPHPPGSVPDTVPHTFGDYPSDPAWGTAYPGVVHSTWRMLGDAGLAAEHYPDLQLYIDFMLGEANKTGIGQLYQSYGCVGGAVQPARLALPLPSHARPPPPPLPPLQRLVPPWPAAPQALHLWRGAAAGHAEDGGAGHGAGQGRGRCRLRRHARRPGGRL
jgi:alpha-L-rhamnosidase